MDSLTSSKKEQLHEVANGMLEIYHTLVRMRYLDSSWIIEGPHNIDDLLPMYQSHGLDASVIYLYSILPYIEVTGGAGRIDFFQGGRFADFRNKDDVETGRDPLYEGSEEEAMRPWMTPLSLLGNHRSVIIYSARTHCIWIHDQESCGSTDRNLHEGKTVFTGEEWDRHQEECRKLAEASGEGREEEGNGEEDSGEGENGEEGNGEEDSGKEGSGEEDSGEESNNEEENGEEDSEEEEDEDDEHDFYDVGGGRPALNVLRDIVKWFNELIELPGDGDESGMLWDLEFLAPLYLKHGWPSAQFDGDSFQIDQVRAAAAKRAKGVAEEPMDEVQRIAGWVNDVGGYRKRKRADQLSREAAATTDDELWIARWELWASEDQDRHMTEELQNAEAAKDLASPGGQLQKPDELPLWEERQLRMDLWEQQRFLKKIQKEAEQPPKDNKLKENIGLKLRYKEKQAAIYQKAYEASRLDAERLFPRRLFTVSLGVETNGVDYEDRMERLNKSIEEAQRRIKLMQEWLVQVPNSAQNARQVVEGELDRTEEHLQSCERQRRSVASALEEIRAGKVLK